MIHQCCCFIAIAIMLIISCITYIVAIIYVITYLNPKHMLLGGMWYVGTVGMVQGYGAWGTVVRCRGYGGYGGYGGGVRWVRWMGAVQWVEWVSGQCSGRRV